MKIFKLIVITISCTYWSVSAQVVELHPDSTDRFVMDPATFNGDENSESIWEPAPFGRKDPTIYEYFTRDNGEAAIKATSDNSISSVNIDLRAKAQDFPIIEWEWKVNSVLENGDITKKDGDDYAARIYITFDYPVSELSFGDKIKYRFYKTFTSFDVPTRAINYIWANKAEVGSIHPNPYTDWVQVIAVESGNKHAGSWRREKRNILEDYRKIFGEDPPEITSIQIMTDSDNTGGSAVAYYGKIVLRKESISSEMND